MPLKHFRSSQTRAGVWANPWRNGKTYRSAFIIAKFAGHVFWRKGSRRFPIERVAGPNVPKEMIKDAVAVAFQTVTATDLPARVEHEVRAITKGVLS